MKILILWCAVTLKISKFGYLLHKPPLKGISNTEKQLICPSRWRQSIKYCTTRLLDFQSQSISPSINKQDVTDVFFLLFSCFKAFLKPTLRWTKAAWIHVRLWDYSWTLFFAFNCEDMQLHHAGPWIWAMWTPSRGSCWTSSDSAESSRSFQPLAVEPVD